MKIHFHNWNAGSGAPWAHIRVRENDEVYCEESISLSVEEAREFAEQVAVRLAGRSVELSSRRVQAADVSARAVDRRGLSECGHDGGAGVGHAR